MKDAKGHGSDSRGGPAAHSSGVDQIGRASTIAKAETQRLLSKAGIDDGFSVKVKAFPADDEHSMALYRARSQFGGNGPIMWLNEKLPDMMKEHGVEKSKLPEIMTDSMSHEYGHVMYEFAEYREPELYKTINDYFHGDEEKFAEGFSMHLNGREPNPVYDRVIKGYSAALTKARSGS